MKHPLGDARSRRLEELVNDLMMLTTRPPEMADAVFSDMIRRMALHQLVDEELRRRGR
jgi:hypothetical protein